jgi:DNA-binding SARP family transcriptional activator
MELEREKLFLRSARRRYARRCLGFAANTAGAHQRAQSYVPAAQRQARPAAGESMLVEILTRSVRRGAATIELREREQMLLVALARRRRASSRAELVGLLWPDLDETSARDALNTCLYRLRQRLGEDAVVWSREDGYRLHHRVRVDLQEIEEGLASIRGRRILQRQERTMLRALHDRLREARIEAGELEWLEPIVARIREMRHFSAERLAREALLHGENAEALRLARELLDDDPCDETACELAIRAHLAAGDRAAAARQYRNLRDVLRRLIDVEPSRELAQLAFGSAQRAEARELSVA